MLSLVIPAHDVAPVIRSSLGELLVAADGWPELVEILVVDDGSSDETVAIVERAAEADGRVRLVRLGHNAGKGAAVRAGVRASRGEVVLFTDADLPYAPADVRRVVDRVRDGADVAVGARSAAAGGKAAYGLRRRVASAAYGRIVGRMFALAVSDTQCGLKAFRGDSGRAIFDALTIDGFAFDIEVLLLARRWGMHVAAVPVTMRPSAGSSIRLARHSWQMLGDLVDLHRRARRGELPGRSEPA